jgi:hypothetical protein
MPSRRSQGWTTGGASCLLFAWAACGGAPPPRAPEAAPALVATASGPSTSAEPPAPEPAAPEPATSPDPVSPDAVSGDTSLPLDVYRAAGVPELDHPWSVADYERCLQVFVELLRSSRAELPRHGSARSGVVFAHVIDERNFQATPGLTAGEHARHLQAYLQVYPGLLKVYSPASDRIDFSVEQAELIVGLLELLKSALEASRQWSAADPRWTEEYERQKQMTLAVVRGVRSMLAEPERYSPVLRQRLKAELARRAPALERHLSAEDAREVHAIAQPTGDTSAADSEPLR